MEFQIPNSYFQILSVSAPLRSDHTRSLSSTLRSVSTQVASLAQSVRAQLQSHAQEVASVAVFLASDAAVRVNGVTVPIDSGWLTY